MADRPIIFSAPMIQALLAGRKTQTRRIFTPPAPFAPEDDISVELAAGSIKPRYAIGDRLWVREKCQAFEQSSGEDGVHYPADEAWHPIQAGSRGAADDWLTLYSYGRRRGAVVPSIHMPRWASRITLVVTDARVERLNDISHKDAAAEGLLAERTPAGGILRNVATDVCLPLARTRWQGAPHLPLRGMERTAFRDLWESIHGAEGWSANPWVAAISFSVHLANIDALSLEVAR